MTFQIFSPAFEHKAPIPARYTCQGENCSPELSWTGAPPGAAAFALIMDDPDAPAGTWVHWLLYDIPVSLSGLPQALPTGQRETACGVQGRNSWGRIGYGGPCPPQGTHRYFFKLYALSAATGLPAGEDKPALLKGIHDRTLAMTELMGTFSKH